MTPTTPLESPWRDMASAPKDGTKIDLLYPYPRSRTIDCMWDEGMGWIRRTPCWDAGELLPESDWSISTYPNMDPLGWMPAPTSAPRHPNELLEAAKEVAIAMSVYVPSAEAVQHSSVEWKRIYETYHKLRTAIRNYEQGGGG